MVGPDERVVRAKDEPAMRDLVATGNPATDERARKRFEVRLASRTGAPGTRAAYDSLAERTAAW